jgi:hypothetical protein
MNIFGTITASNHLHKAMVLAKSIKTHMPNSKIVVCIVEEEVPSIAVGFTYFDEVVLAKNLGFDNFYRFIFQYNVYEGSSGCKGQLLQYMLEKYVDGQNFIYLDSDIKVYAPFTELFKELQKHPIILTPHHVRFPENIDEELTEWYRNYGLYNAGFLAIRKSKEADSFISWWVRRLNRFSYIKFEKGLFMDQKWLDYAPCYFETFSFKNPCYNVAFWNLRERTFRFNHSYEVLVNEERLCFFHYSHVDLYLVNKINEMTPNDKYLIDSLRISYKKELEENKNSKLENKPWSYDYFANGEKIAESSRIRYRDSFYLQSQYPHPFQFSNQAFHV